MQTLKFKTVIDEDRVLSFTLPADVRPGAADVTVVLEEDENTMVADMAKPSFEAVLEALMHFGDGRRLGGLSIREMAGEGRR